MPRAWGKMSRGRQNETDARTVRVCFFLEGGGRQSVSCRGEHRGSTNNIPHGFGWGTQQATHETHSSVSSSGTLRFSFSWR